MIILKIICNHAGCICHAHREITKNGFYNGNHIKEEFVCNYYNKINKKKTWTNICVNITESMLADMISVRAKENRTPKIRINAQSITLNALH